MLIYTLVDTNNTNSFYNKVNQFVLIVFTYLTQNNSKFYLIPSGYDNTEKVELASLLESDGLQSQIAQHKACLQDKTSASFSSPPEASGPSSEPRKMNGVPGENMDCDFHETKPSKNSFTSMPSASSFIPTMGAMPPAPPLPPHLMSKSVNTQIKLKVWFIIIIFECFRLFYDNFFYIFADYLKMMQTPFRVC